MYLYSENGRQPFTSACPSSCSSLLLVFLALQLQWAFPKLKRHPPVLAWRARKVEWRREEEAAVDFASEPLDCD